jgi:hypothetical protein
VTALFDGSGNRTGGVGVGIALRSWSWRDRWVSRGDADEVSVMRGFQILVAGSLRGFPRSGLDDNRRARPERLLETRSAIVCRVGQ